jgi:hypothetical protein
MLKYEAGIELVGNLAGQGCFPRSDITLNYYIVILNFHSHANSGSLIKIKN